MALVSVVETNVYLARATRLMSEAEREAVIDQVAANPAAGDLIPGSGGLRKMRVPLEGRGKRGGGRVIYWFHSERMPVVLLFVFAKNETSDLTPDQARMLARAVADMADDFGG
jgi:RelE toxin of RelE / RelB toxin-antitoxin system